MITISLCMIVKNEEFTLGRCLQSVKDIADEIIIVDTGSCDETKKVAMEFNTEIYDFKWMDDFSAARNFSFSKATMDYILWLDADDVIPAEDRSRFLKMKQEMKQHADIVMMRYNIETDRHGYVSCSIYRERLIKRSSNPLWKGYVHEHIPVSGDVVFSDVCISHQKKRSSSGRNLKILQKAISQGLEDLSPRNLFYLGKELFEIGKYEEGIKYYKMLLESGESQPSYSMEASIDVARYYMMKNEREKVLKTLFKAFEYDSPRAETCCYIAAFFKEVEDYQKAISWYKTALALEKPDPLMDYVIHDCWGYLPCIELCHCCYMTGDITEAVRYNEMAALYKPGDPGIAQNNEFFRELLNGYSSEY